MSIYVLQKDMPNLSKGSELIKADNGWYYVDRDNFGMYFSLFNKVVENNTEWFKLKEESVKVLDIINDGYTATFVKKHHLKVTLNRFIPSTQLQKVKEAIEKVLNEDLKNKKVYNPING